MVCGIVAGHMVLGGSYKERWQGCENSPSGWKEAANSPCLERQIRVRLRLTMSSLLKVWLSSPLKSGELPLRHFAEVCVCLRVRNVSVCVLVLMCGDPKYSWEWKLNCVYECIPVCCPPSHGCLCPASWVLHCPPHFHPVIKHPNLVV